MRTFDLYDPAADLANRYPEWLVVVRLLDGAAEIICPISKMLILDQPWHDDDPDFAVAHGLAHIDLHLASGGDYSELMERDADDLAHMRLDRWIVE